ncbi:hypothetical protein [Streptomyces canus]|uniref:hypothetical protein n=1 Tax=Streptomyces canus TaxID=58343 RepID=UPI00324F1296
MDNLEKVTRPLEFIRNLMGPVAGAMLLMAGIAIYRHGGSVGWPVAGSALLLINTWEAWRRFARRKKPSPSS